MNTMTIKRNKMLPFLNSKKNRILFIAINIYLILGVGSLLITMFYLIGHLNQADSIFKYCIPGLVLGVSAGIFYFVGYQSMVSEQFENSSLAGKNTINAKDDCCKNPGMVNQQK
jgi:ABC-type glycerol-3-phosphate transport system permease component